MTGMHRAGTDKRDTGAVVLETEGLDGNTN